MEFATRVFTGAAMSHAIFAWPAAAAFFIGAIVNASGHPKVCAGFVKLGFPVWWRWVTALLELVTAMLLVMTGTVFLGVASGACVMLAAIVAIVRIRNYRELPPPLTFLLLLMLAGYGGM